MRDPVLCKESTHEGEWGEYVPCNQPATRWYLWRNAGLREHTGKCEKHGPELEERFQRHGTRWERAGKDGRPLPPGPERAPALVGRHA
jgi:hypothetical protein